MMPALLLQGCAGRQASAWASLASLRQGNGHVDAATLRPDFRYLRVTIADKAVLMVLGYVDQDAQGRPVMVWYSADGEVLRTQAGRLVGLVGTPWEWRRVSLPSNLPAWSSASVPQRFSREVDEMPGYRWGHVDHVLLRRIDPPSSGTALKSLPPEGMGWFEERVEGDRLPPARYAMHAGATEPSYGEQCLHAGFCLSWQSWPAEGAPTSKP